MSKKAPQIKGMTKFLIMKNGEKKKVIGKTGRYYVVADSQFRKGSSQIADVVSEAVKTKEAKDTENTEEE